MKSEENEKVRILPSRLRAGSDERSVAFTGVVMAVLVLNGMKASFWLHCPRVASALRRDRLANL